MFCPQASLLAPLNKNQNAKSLVVNTNSDGQNDVILKKDENGNTYLHLVMPATGLNFLNGSDGSRLFDFPDNTNMYAGDYNNVFVEVGCKVFEVNKVFYKDNEAPVVLKSATLWASHCEVSNTKKRGYVMRDYS